jgi:hypothetical protein
MRIADVLKLAGGSAVVYFVIAACNGHTDSVGKAPSGEAGTPLPGDPTTTAFADEYKSGTRLKIRYYEGADGARQFVNFLDTQYQQVCNVRQDSAKAWRCLPQTTAGVYYEAGCATPKYVVMQATDPQKIAVDVPTPAAEVFYQIGDPVAAPPALYRKEPIGVNGCTPVGTGDGATVYAIGAQLPLDAFEEMTIKNE